MKRTHLNELVDGLAFVAFLFLLTTGLLLEYQLPAGSGGAQGYGSGHGALNRPVLLVWGWTRHEWGQLHYWIALAMMAVLAFHLVLHWKWIVCTVRGKPSTASGYRLMLGGVGLAFTVLLAAVPIMSGSSTISRGELRELRAGTTDSDAITASEPQSKSTELETARGSMSLRQISQNTGIPVAKLIENVGLPTNVDVDAGAGRLLRQHNLTMNDLRKTIDSLKSAAKQTKGRRQ
jgi:hypothetical protein